MEFAEESRASNNTVIPNQCALLSWESPSNSRLLNVIQTVLFVPFSGIHLREIVLLTRRLPRQCALLYRNDREFAKFQFAVLRRWRDSISGNIKKRGCLTKKSFRQNKQKHCHCEPVTDVTGVAISRLKGIQPLIRWRFPRQCAHWLGMQCH